MSKTPQVLLFESSTDGTSSANSSQENAKLKSTYFTVSENSCASESDKVSIETDYSRNERVKLKSKHSIISVNSSTSESENISSSETDSPLVRDSTVKRRSTRKFCLPKHLSPRHSGSGNTNSSVEFVSETIPSAKKKYTRKSLPRTPKLVVPKSESQSENKLRSLKYPIDLVLTPKQIQNAKINPCVTLSRGIIKIKQGWRLSGKYRKVMLI